MGCGLDGREGAIGREMGWKDARVLLLGRLAMSRAKGWSWRVLGFFEHAGMDFGETDRKTGKNAGSGFLVDYIPLQRIGTRSIMALQGKKRKGKRCLGFWCAGSGDYLIYLTVCDSPGCIVGLLGMWSPLGFSLSV